MEADKGWIFGLQPFSVDDGPGIRTAVFLKGCGARCLWCHNPESIEFGPSILYKQDLCTGCGSCSRVCRRDLHHLENGVHTWDRNGCDRCGACARACPSGALRIVGEERTVGDLVDELERDRRFFEETGGGVTISGGEPTAQPKFAVALARACKERGLGTALETNGAGAAETYRAILPYIDTFLFDIKAGNAGDYWNLTGIRQERVLANLRLLSEAGKDIVVRCPIIPGVNNGPDLAPRIAEVSRWPHVLGYELMPYHSMGVAKARQAGVPMETYEKPTEVLLNELHNEIAALGGRRWENM